MRIVSWNVNGIRAILKKDFAQSFVDLGADVMCFQETKAQCEQVAQAIGDIDGYSLVSSSAAKKGYSGTAILSKVAPLSVKYGIGVDELDQEGRVIAAEFEQFILVTVYTPNSGSELKRLSLRQEWDAEFLSYIQTLENIKPVLICGDLNVAHKDIDLARPKPNFNKSAGYMQEEIDGINNLVNAGYVDTFRQHHPDEVKYTWWSYRAGARERNVGWRIDYFLASQAMMHMISGAGIHKDILGSDHCPVSVELSLPL